MPVSDTRPDPAEHVRPEATCDVSTVCGNCYAPMRPEGAHYRCDLCGWRDSCCDGVY